MNELVSDNWLLIVAMIAIGAIIGFLIIRPRQRVRLSSDTPIRPHMTKAARSKGQGRGLAAEAAAAASDVTGQFLKAGVHAELPGASGPPDDLERLKGVGPKLAQMLNAQGITTFAQIARLTPGEIERLDINLGAFRGRLSRDKVTEQAGYLARGDEDGFEQRFGKL